VSLSPADIERIAEAVARRLEPEEPWLDRKGLARHFSCSVRSIELAWEDGMPSRVIFGRRKSRASYCQRWLDENDVVLQDGADQANGAATAATAPRHDREVSPDGSI